MSGKRHTRYSVGFGPLRLYGSSLGADLLFILLVGVLPVLFCGLLPKLVDFLA